jgi:hypothetical protein
MHNQEHPFQQIDHEFTSMLSMAQQSQRGLPTPLTRKFYNFLQFDTPHPLAKE